jgi:histidinol-phosphate aminotransferase
MQTRREWFKSTLALGAGLSFTSSLTAKLMASPMSNAERAWAGMKKQATTKVRLNANENPYGPPDKAKQAIGEILVEANRYPFQVIPAMKALLAKKEGVSPDYIHLGAGSGDLLCQAGVAFGLEGGGIMSPFPTFPLLMSYAEVFNTRWDKINLNDKLEVDYDLMASSIKPDTRLIFICNPNNPSGTLVDPKKVEMFCRDISGKVPVYADEAYLEFLDPAQQISLVDLVRKDMDVIVSRTFSKVYGLAGLRIGYLVAKPDLIKKISKYAGDFPVSQTALAAAQSCLGDEEWMKSVRTRNAEARAVLTDYLDKKKIVAGKSVTNFVFFPATKDGKTILSRMDEKGYLMRIWDYKQKEWCRVSIGTADEMRGFVKAFDDVIS